jgi:hypothetical protein
MKPPYVNQSLLIAVILYSNILACSSPTLKVHDVTVQSANNYTLSQTISGLIIALDLFVEEDRLQQCFGCDFLSYGVLPILVVAENHSTDQVFLMEKSGVTLLVKKPDDINRDYNIPIPISGVAKQNNMVSDELRTISNKEYAASLFMVLSPAVGILVAASLPGSYQNVSAITQITQNMKRKELSDRTIYPGESHNGFIYIQVDKKEMIDVIESISLNAKNTRTGEILTFNFYLNKRRYFKNAH